MSIPSDLRERVLALPEADRANLAHEILLSLEPDRAGSDPDREEAWAVELERRRRRYESGQARLIDADDALEQLREDARRRRNP